MDKVTYLEYLEKMSQMQLQDYLEAVWREEIEINEAQEKWLEEHLKMKKARKLAAYIMIWLVLLSLLKAVPEYDGPIKRVFDNLEPIEPKAPNDFDLVWIAQAGACDKCAPLHGKVWGKEISAIPQLHPNCRCILVSIPKGMRAMNKIRMLEAGAVRAISEGQKRILEVLAAPFGSPNRKDRLGQYLSPNTDFMCDVGDRRPTLYLHGFSPRGRAMKQPMSIGFAEVTKIDSKGLWMRTELDKSELSDRTWEAALEGNARASTGSVNYLERHDKVTGEVLCWPIAELSVFDGGEDRVPVSDDALVLPLRALFDEQGIKLPDDFEAGEDKKDKEVKSIRTKEVTMDEKTFEELYAQKKAEEQAKLEKEEALRAEIRKEEIEKLKSAKYRSTFNINTIDDSKAKKDAGEEETFAFCRGLIEQGRAARDGRPIPGMWPGYGQDQERDAKRVLEETQALELGPMVPEDLHNKIHGLLGKYSLVDKMAAKGLIDIYKTDKLTFSVPTETTAMTALADIAEEGAYVANEMAFAAKTATMQKVGNYLSVTEEALEDQDLFQQYLPKAVAKAIALSKNLDLHTLCDAIAGTAIATTDVIVDGEITGMYYGLAQEYRENACMIMGDGTLGYIRAMLIATPRAYGEFGFNYMSMGELGERFLNKPVFTNGNWVDLVGGATNDAGITFGDFTEGMYWVERRKLGIFVDPYSTRLAAGTVNFLPSARYAGVTVNTAAFNGIELLT